MPYVIVTGQCLQLGEGAGAFVYFDKPADPTKVLQAVEDIFKVEDRYLVRDNA